MKNLLGFIGLLVITFLYSLFMGLLFSASIKGDENSSWDKFYSAIRQVESSGNDKAIGDNGKSKGPYQIQIEYWTDGGGKVEEYDTKVFERSACEKVMMGYWKRYCSKAVETKDWKTLARVHNGGPSGHKKNSTLKYWDKVKAEMEK